MSLQTHGRDVCEQLTAAGLPTVTDPRNARIPGGVLFLEQIDRNTLGGPRTVTWTLVLLGSPSGTDTALGTFDTLLDDLEDVLDINTVRATTVRDANLSPDPIPALVTTLITEE